MADHGIDACRRQSDRLVATLEPLSEPLRHYAVLLLAALTIGVSSASIETGIAGVISDHTPLTSRAAAMSGWNAITGARGLVAAFLMGTLVQFGVVSVTVGLLLCVAASTVGVALFWWAARQGRLDDRAMPAVEPASVRSSPTGLHQRIE